MQEQERGRDVIRESERRRAASQGVDILSVAAHSQVEPERLVCQQADTGKVAKAVAAHGSFKAVCLCDGPVSHISPVADATYAQAICFYRFGGYDVIYACHQIPEVVSAPIV